MADEVKKRKPKTSKVKAPDGNIKEPFEKREDLKKLLFYVIIVNNGQGDNIRRILRSNHSSAQFTKIGEGTASKKVKTILNIEDSTKEIIYSLVNESAVPDIKKELDAYFAINKRNAGLAFTIELKTIMGVKLYKFFSQTVRG